ncbi:hypothetical protein C7974DRAFT_403967 [Boeremia exigua]|uniref:uncharacterized protein n=1 Tax=Boeremia exigua TaxID=749465 RepID=UPI001E8CE61F|nr:uncharacterized protein C7974DRAFT_403967 [Boeremia exigua]KAH6613877.1 hypothetical protein C7974DRAFT_403967 [Boeremia exigua]
MSDQKTHFMASTQYFGPSPASDGLLPDGRSRRGYQRAWLRLRQCVHKLWLLELSASILSLVFFAAICVVLKVYENLIVETTVMMKRPHIYPILAILGAMMRATMLLPVATAIGQLKWSWFRSRSRTLVDMERFDEATRGIYGSAKLLFYLRFRNIAVIGAALTIMALPLDAIIQSAVHLSSETRALSQLNEYSLASHNDEPVRLERATSYMAFENKPGSNDVWPETPMINAIQFGQGYTNGLNDMINAQASFNCSTGYCNYKTSQTLSIDYKCTNRFDIITVGDIVTEEGYQTLPGTDLKLHLSERIDAKSYSQWPDEAKSTYPNYEKSLFGENHDGLLIVGTSMLYRTGNGAEDTNVNNGTYAMECALFWHVKTTQMYVNASRTGMLEENSLPIHYFSNGTSKERNKPISIRREQLDTGSWLLTPEICIVDDEEIDSSAGDFYMDNCVHLVGGKAAEGLQNLLKGVAYGLTEGSITEQSADGTQLKQSNLFALNMEKATWNKLAEEAQGNVTTMWANIAFGVSFTVRRTQSLQMKGLEVSLYVTGTASQIVFYYSIVWSRLAIPAGVLLCCTLFVLSTALRTRNEHAWRRSTLPLLFHGLEDHEQIAHGDVRDFTIMKDIAGKMRVRLEEHAEVNGARLMSRN